MGNGGREEFPDELNLQLKRIQILRYGENPHQKAALYSDHQASQRPCAARARKVQGKELSYNNLLDADAAFECVAEFSDPAVAIVKHMNPCGAALGKDARDAYLKALAADPVSAFGGVVGLNRQLDGATAAEIALLFVEVVIAPDANLEALSIIAKRPNIRLLLTSTMPDLRQTRYSMRSIEGGILMQEYDNIVFDADPRVVTKRSSSEREMADMQFAFTVAKHVKSNAIVFAKESATVGIGAGQMSRIDAVKIGAEKGGKNTIGSVMASDAFFPFRDSVDEAHKAGVTAIIQPGGSQRDQELIEAANAHNIAMVFTGIRHFRH